MAVREGLLSLLEPGPRYGYQLKTEFEAVTGGVWTLNVGQVYTTLDRLERDGLVVMNDTDGQKQYTLTPAGREELGAWWQAIPAEDPPPRDELMLKVLMAIEKSTDHALAVITRQRTALFNLLQQHRRERPSPSIDAAGSPSALAAVLVTDALVVRAEADLRWLDLCESRLVSAVPRSARKDPA
jgi:DNA-binding PadR family transcriptional regulator